MRVVNFRIFKANHPVASTGLEIGTAYTNQLEAPLETLPRRASRHHRVDMGMVTAYTNQLEAPLEALPRRASRHDRVDMGMATACTNQLVAPLEALHGQTCPELSCLNRTPGAGGESKDTPAAGPAVLARNLRM